MVGSPHLHARTRLLALAALAAILGLAASAFCSPAFAEPIRGAGSTFAAPIINQWSRDYEAARTDGGDYTSPDWRVDYEPVGSLAGVMSLDRPEIDFAATDAPLPPEELSKRGWAQFPIVMGGIAVVANLDDVGAGRLRLSGPVLADIYLGRITKWSDPAIKALNPDIELPDAAIEVLHRLDGSGSTFAFTSFLSKVSDEWRRKVGADTLVEWPLGRAEKGTAGLAALTAATRNSVAYLEYGQVVRAGLPFVSLQNASGAFVSPKPEAFQAGLATVDWDASRGFHADTINLAAPGAYPIAVVTYAVLPRDRAENRISRVLDLFRLAFHQGAERGAALGYIAVHPELVGRIETYWSQSFGYLNN
jgi:phosphate transport system substrate-binding protein